MPLEPVTALLLLAFLTILLLLLSLCTMTLWSRRAAPPADEGEALPRAPRGPPPPPRRNDDWRGERAQAQRSARKKAEGDPFESLLRGKNDELDF